MHPDALAVVAWNDESPTTYLVEEIITAKQDITGLVEQITALTKKYDIGKMTMDAGGLGKKVAEELRRRHHIPVQDADKAKKQQTVEFLNDALRLGKFKAKSDSRFVSDSYQIQIDWDKTTPDKIVIKKSHHSDIIDAVIYAFKESPAYTYRKESEKPKYGTEAWAKKETEEMFESELEAAQKQQEYEKWARGEYE